MNQEEVSDSEKNKITNNPKQDDSTNTDQNGTTPLEDSLTEITNSLLKENEPNPDSSLEKSQDLNLTNDFLKDEEEIKIETKDETNPQIFDATQPHEVIQPQIETNEHLSSSSSKAENENVQYQIIPDSDRDLDEAISQLLNKFILPPQELHTPIMQLLERRRVDALVEGDYDKAEEQDKIVGILQMVIQNEHDKENEDKTLDVLYGRWQQLIQKQNSINEKWDKKVQEFTEESDKQKEEMDKAHEEEVDNFLAKWKDPNFLRQFNKPSSRLLQLREQEKAMAIARMYAQAKEMKAVADRLQREETQQAQARMNSQMQIERNKLTVKQNKAVNAWNGYRQRMLKSMQNERQKELQPIQTAMQQIKAKKTSPLKGSGAKRQQRRMRPSALPNLPPTRAESSLSDANHRPGNVSHMNNNYSPRTQAIYSRFRSEKKTTLLDVAPVDDSTLMAMKKPTTARSRSNIGNASTRVGPTVKRAPVTKKVPTRK